MDKKKGLIKLLGGHLLMLVISIVLLFGACKKLAEVDAPDTSTSTDNVYKDNSTASAVFIGLYARISQKFFNGGLASFSVFGDLSADNLTLYDVNSSRHSTRYYTNDLDPKYLDEGQTYWHTCYDLLYTINDAIIKLSANEHLDKSVSTRLLGEAYFLRSFCYFYLVNFYGDVPLILTTDPETNAKAARTPASIIYDQMITDLSEAERLLTIDYVGADVTQFTIERVRPNLGAVNALQARIFLNQRDYNSAEAAATKVISNSIYSLTTLENTFLKNSSETIWGLQSVTYGINTFAGRYLLLPESGPDGGDYNLFLSNSLIHHFEPGDQRKISWIDSVKKGGSYYHYPTKYKIPVIPGSANIGEYDIVLRLSEQFLIRAEARNEIGNTNGAIEDVNTLRSKRRAPVTDDITQPLPPIRQNISKVLLRQILLNERRSELFTEWGHRWFDMKRTNIIDSVMSKHALGKGASWKSYKSIFPIPSREILYNKSITQNPGYLN
ncbi:RagB/SusD family nutrient uptake outer membrane protein [Chitinophaga rhizophila]|uniref:RagB/SusD family nutrient uptake outer membrane protein n=1 Tax=Chitinophaga rhizophila TaxID=2866212 RepID=A0ABS7G8C6_9BACT|nr:RagB/SusD family nutrient uptake outer membrane protein [Chitinophaga rhizophila]MBW8683039.1 RagB/SusD family nutrient uptake outer membrane protein [Chitinophaga rhizophila]